MYLSKKKSLKIFNNQPVVAAMPICNSISINVYFACDDYVIWNYSCYDLPLHQSKVKFDSNGQAFFRVSNVWHSLNEFIRVDL